MITYDSQYSLVVVLNMNFIALFDDLLRTTNAG